MMDAKAQIHRILSEFPVAFPIDCAVEPDTRNDSIAVTLRSGTISRIFVSRIVLTKDPSAITDIMLDAVAKLYALLAADVEKIGQRLKDRGISARDYTLPAILERELAYVQEELRIVRSDSEMHSRLVALQAKCDELTEENRQLRQHPARYV